MLLVWDKLQSINNMYIRTKTGVTLGKEARDFKKEVTKQVKQQLPKNLPFDKNTNIKMSLHFILKARFFNRDTTNFVKLVEDTIYDEMGLNDGRNLEVDLKKSYFKKSKQEYIKVTLEESLFDFDYFNRETDPEDKPDLNKEVYTKEEVESAYKLGLSHGLNTATFEKGGTEKSMKEQIKKFKTNNE